MSATMPAYSPPPSVLLLPAMAYAKSAPSSSVLPAASGFCSTMLLANAYSGSCGRSAVPTVGAHFCTASPTLSGTVNALSAACSTSLTFFACMHLRSSRSQPRRSANTSLSTSALSGDLNSSGSGPLCDTPAAMCLAVGASGVAKWMSTDWPPADWPKMVILLGSPPNAATLAAVHAMAARWSAMPTLPSVASVYIKPRLPRR
mmetsp:Transcript_27072/g.65765  ORF Transcript_27072/g.65765 Transcript_27072/m.65765 type:complete len:203 (+) Transcript_27072:631-1239(+)